MNRRTVVFILLGLVLLAGIAGAGMTIYNFGVAEGVVRAAQVDKGGIVVGPWAGAFGAGFALFGLVRLILFAGLIFFVGRWLVWGRPGGLWRGGRDEAQRQFDDWHRRAHEEGTGSSAG